MEEKVQRPANNDISKHGSRPLPLLSSLWHSDETKPWPTPRLQSQKDLDLEALSVALPRFLINGNSKKRLLFEDTKFCVFAFVFWGEGVVIY